MERREFLRKGLALGTVGLLPGVGLTASDCLSFVSEAQSTQVSTEELIPMEDFQKAIERTLKSWHVFKIQGTKLVSELRETPVDEEEA